MMNLSVSLWQLTDPRLYELRGHNIVLEVLDI